MMKVDRAGKVVVAVGLGHFKLPQTEGAEQLSPDPSQLGVRIMVS